MSVHRIVSYPITNLSGKSKKTVPVGSNVIDAVAFTSTKEVVYVLIAEPVVPDGEVVAYMDIELLTLNATTPFSDPDEDKLLHYIGSVVWDNGYKIHHIFQIQKWADVEDDSEESEPEFVGDVNLPEPPQFTQEEFNKLQQLISEEDLAAAEASVITDDVVDDNFDSDDKELDDLVDEKEED